METVVHTPGPWMVEPINGGETFQVTTAERTGFAVIAETPIDGTGRDEANARAIAEVPAMIGTLREAVERGPHNVRCHAAYRSRLHDPLSAEGRQEELRLCDCWKREARAILARIEGGVAL